MAPRVFRYLDFALSRPVNSSVRLFSGDYHYGVHSDTFVVNDNYTELVVTTDGPIHFLNVTNPQGSDSGLNAVISEEWGSMFIVKNPLVGNWKIDVKGGGAHSIRVEGFKAKNSSYPATVRKECSCLEDEECKTVNGADGCYCKDGREIQGFEDLDLELKCDSQHMMASFRTCQLRGFNVKATSVHLSDGLCRGVPGGNSSRISILSELQEAQCGNQLHNNGTHAIYKNSMHVHMESTNMIARSHDVQINFSCSYPLDLMLKTEASPIVSSVRFSIEGSGQFKASMFLYKDKHYISTYDEPEVVLFTSETLYAGVTLEGSNTSQYTVVMKNCYATPSKNKDDPLKYYIIKERCPSKEDASIRVMENGVSTRGRFSVQMFKFVGNHNLVYLHCEINVCDTTIQVCKPSCSAIQSRRAKHDDPIFILEFGPILLNDFFQFSFAVGRPSLPGLMPIILLWSSLII